MDAKKRLILLASISLLASTTALGGFSYAWFTQTRQHTVNLQAVQVTAPGTNITDYKCYGVTQLTKDATTTNVTFVNQERFELPRYDPQGINYSTYLRAIAIHVTFEYSGTQPISFLAITDNATFSTGTPGTGDYDNNFTSNVFQVSLSSGTTLIDGWTSATLSYTNSVSKSFVTFNPSPTKTSSFVFKTINPGETEAWFVIEYYEPAMLYINDARASEEHPVVYTDDIVYRIS